MPLHYGSRVTGAIVVSKLGLSQFDEDDLRLLEVLAGHAAVALENARLYEEARREAATAHSLLEDLERTFLSTVEALANALEARDEYTSSHARWITDTALRVGQELGLDGDTLKRLELGALFHDIGKIGIPNSVLLKPGPLTAEERELIETHPELGAKIIAPIDQLQGVCDIVRACHERWDGEGYPDRKAGRRDPARGPDHLRLRRVPRDDDRPALPERARPGGGAAAARGGGRLAVRPARRRGLPARARARPRARAELRAGRRRSERPLSDGTLAQA